MEEDGWGRDSELGYATQTAVFTRLDGEEYERLRAENTREYSQVSRQGAKPLATHYHAPHPAATSPHQSNEVILELIKGEIDRGEDNKILLRYLWIEEDICCACSGRIDVLIDTIKAAENILRLDVTDPGAKEDWVVELIGSSKRRKENLWEERENETVETYEEMADDETTDAIEESEGIEWENGDSGVDVTMEYEETVAPSGWDMWAERTGGWGSQANDPPHAGWGMGDNGAGAGDWGRWDVGSSWTTYR